MPPPPSKNYHYSKCQLYVGEVGEYNRPEWDDFEDSTRFVAYPASCFPYLNRFPEYLQRALACPGRAGTTSVTVTRGGGTLLQSTRKSPCLANYAFRGQNASNARIRNVCVLAIDQMNGNSSYPVASAYDTTLENVQKITYQMPFFNPKSLSPLPRHAEEKDYLDYVYNKGPYDAAQPFEAYLQLDLANPHSRAKKLERWKIRQSGIQARRKEILEDELKNREGRTEKQIRADAAFLWRQEMEKDAKERKKARWMNTPRVKNWDRKANKKTKKEERKRRRLTELTLEEESNQVIPKTLKRIPL